jgi:FecR protein
MQQKEPMTMKGIAMKRLLGLSGLITCLLGAASPGQAASDIGRAIAVQPNVDGVMPDRSSPLRKDDRVIQDETIATGDGGKAQLQFIDATNLAIGPSSRVRLDKFVFAGKSSAKTFILNATIGAFRFATGHSAHTAYEILTPAAVIGVRGTRFSFQVFAQRLALQVEQGMVVVCPLTGHSGCVEARPGQSVQASAGSLPVIVAAGAPPRPPQQGPFASPTLPIDIGIGLLPIGGPGNGIRTPPRLPGRRP